MSPSAITFHNVNKTYPGGNTAVANLTLEIPQRSLTVFVGPSGCGKTTSLRMINRMIEPTSGHIHVNGRNITDLPPATLRRSMGYVMQASGLLPHRTVLENIATVPRLLGQSKRAATQRAYELLETIGLDHSLGNRYPAQLSGGQQQRVGVARALAADPPILLMDEPFSAVDPMVRTELHNELLHLKNQLHKTIVFVTHDIDEAMLLGDKIAVFATGGTLAQYATPEHILRQPADQYVADFIGRDRGIRTLSFEHHNVPISDVLTRGANGKITQPPHSTSTTNGWILDLDHNNRPVGWIPPDQNPGENPPQIGGSLYRPGQSLRSALDAALSSPSGMAVAVNDDGTLRGVLLLQDIMAAVDQARKGRI